MPIARPESRTFRAIAWLVRNLMFTMVRYESRGDEHLPRSGGFIAAANHATEMDSVTFAHYLFDHGYEPRVLAKIGLFRTPVVGWAVRKTRMIPVERGTVDAGRSLDVARAELAAGACVAIFPEGTITRDPDLWPMEGKTGLARIALTTRVPVIPIAQWGANDLLPRYGRMVRPFPRKVVRFVAGPPVDLSDLYDRQVDAAALREATTRVMDAITVLLEGLRGEPAPKERFDLRKHPEYAVRRTTYPPVERP